MEKNDLINVNIDDVSLDGNGIAHYNGKVIFVPYSAIGDKLLIKISEIKKNYAFGHIEKLLSKSA